MMLGDFLGWIGLRRLGIAPPVSQKVLTAESDGTIGTVDPASIGVTDHGALSGLSDDDHTQYLNNTRGDARYDPIGAAASAQAAAESTAAAALSGHVAAGDPHPQYLTAAEGNAAYDTLGAAAAAQAAAEATASTALGTHAADTTSVHGIADTSALLDSGDIGTTVGKLVQLEDVGGGTAGLPAVDGSQLTGLPSGVSDHGALTGLSDPDHVAGSIAFTATDKILGRSSAGAGAGEEIACTAAGRALLDDANASAQRTTLELGTSAVLNVPATGDAASGEVVKGDDSRLTDSRTPTTHSHAISDVTSLQSALDGKQPLDGELTALAGLASAANKLPYFTGSGTASLADLSAAGRALIDDADASAQRTTLGLGALATLSAVEGTAVASTGETGGAKFLREDGDGTCSWQSIPGGGDALTSSNLDQFADVTQSAGKTLSITENTTLAGGTHSGTNTGDQTISLTTDVTGSGTGTIAATIANQAVTNAKLANVSTATIKGRSTAGTGSPEDLTATQATAILNAFTGDSGAGGVKGLVPAPAAGDAAAGKFLKSDGTWSAPAGGGTPGGSNKQVQYNNSSAFGGAAGFEYQAGASPNVLLQAQNATHVPLQIKGAASQSANLLDLRDSAGTVLASLSAAGVLNLPAGAFNSASLGFGATGFYMATHNSGLWIFAGGHFTVKASGFYFKSGDQIVWSSNASFPNNGDDTGLARNAAGEVRVTNASTGTGKMNAYLTPATVANASAANDCIYKSSDSGLATSKDASGNVRTIARDIPVALQVFDKDTTWTTGDDKHWWRVPATFNGYKIVAVAMACRTVSSSGTPTVQIAKVPKAARGTPVDVLSTALTIDVNEDDSIDATTAAVINTSNNTLATGDWVRIDVDVAGTGTKGLEVTLTLRG